MEATQVDAFLERLPREMLTSRMNERPLALGQDGMAAYLYGGYEVPEDYFALPLAEESKRRFADPVYFLLNFRGVSLCNRILMRTVDDEAVLVNDDGEQTFLGKELVALLRRDPEWDWSASE